MSSIDQYLMQLITDTQWLGPISFWTTLYNLRRQHVHYRIDTMQ